MRQDREAQPKYFYNVYFHLKALNNVTSILRNRCVLRKKDLYL